VSGFSLAPGLILPLEVVTQRIAALGVTGSGKSNAGCLIAEALARAGVPVCIETRRGKA